MASTNIEEMPSVGPIVRQSSAMLKFEQIASFYEISDYFAKKMLQLQEFDIVVINDDSYSMDTCLKAGGTRWDEQKNMAKIETDAATMDRDGIDHYFLNRGKFPNIKDAKQAEALFTNTCGGTPLCRTLRQVLNDKRGILNEKKLLIIIITDGQPESIPDFKSILLNERMAGRVFTTIVACTDEDSTMDYLNGWDKEMKGLDVVDDYKSEMVEILKKQGQDFPFSFGDYVVKTLLGSIDREIDKLDEIKLCDMHLLPPEIIEEVQRPMPLSDPVGNVNSRKPITDPVNKPAKVQSCCVIC